MYRDVSVRLKLYEPFWENWYLDDYIGRGSSSTVYKIKQNRFGSIVYAALKVISTSIDDESGINKDAKIKSIEAKKKRAEQEIANMYKLNECPNIVHCNNYAIKDICDESGKIIGFDILIHMDYYTSFAKHLMNNDSVLPQYEVIKLAKQIGSALKSAHDINIIHRDIKPENFFIDGKGNYLLGDLGVSKQVSSSSYSTVAGTHPYMAPEIWRINQTKRYTKTADIYSFGIVLYTLLNNNYLPMVTKDKCSFNDIEEAINKRLAGSPFMPPKNASEELKAIVMKACRYDEKQRYQSMDEFLFDLNKIGKRKEHHKDKFVNINKQQSTYETMDANTDFDDELFYHKNQNQIKCAVCRRPLDKNKKDCTLKTKSGVDMNCKVCYDCYEKVITLQQSNLDYKIIESINYLEPYLDNEFQNGDTTEGKKFKSYINKFIENKKTIIDNSSYEERSENLSIEKTSEDEDWISNKKSVVFRFACILVVIFFLFLIGVSSCVRNIKSDESNSTVNDFYEDYGTGAVMPDLKGLEYENVRESIENDFNIVIEQKKSKKYAEGIIIKQSIPADAEYDPARKNTLKLTISTGSGELINEAIDEEIPITSISLSQNKVNMKINIEVTGEADCPDEFYTESRLNDDIGWVDYYYVDTIYSDFIIVNVNDDAVGDTLICKSSNESIANALIETNNGSTYYLRIYGYFPGQAEITIMNESGNVSKKLKVNIGEKKWSHKSSNPNVLIFDDDSYSLITTGKTTIKWVYGNEVVYKKRVVVKV